MGSSADRKYPHFFQPFLSEHSSERLRIPNAFLEYLDHKLPKKVILRDAHEHKWPVEVLQTEGGSFFLKGWPKFVSKYSLQVGDFLVFKYNGDHMFDILVLGNTGCQKEPVDKENKEEEEEEEEEDDDDNYVDEEEEVMERKKSGSSSRSNRLVGWGNRYSMSGYDARKRQLGIQEFLPSTNPYFVTRLRKSRSPELAIPYETRMEFNLKFSDSIQVEDPEGRLYDGKLVQWKDGRVWVRKGWKKFCKWNNITIHDTLICEFLPSSQGPTCEIMRVRIIRSNKPDD